MIGYPAMVAISIGVLFMVGILISCYGMSVDRMNDDIEEENSRRSMDDVVTSRLKAMRIEPELGNLDIVIEELTKLGIDMKEHMQEQSNQPIDHPLGSNSVNGRLANLEMMIADIQNMLRVMKVEGDE